MNGTYHQKVIIDRPNIVLVGENRDSTRIVLAETAQTRAIPEKFIISLFILLINMDIVLTVIE